MGTIASVSQRILLRRQISFTACGIHSFHPNSQSAFELVQIGTLLPGKKSRSHAALARTAGTANSVNKILRHFGQIIVDDVRNVLNVNATRSQIGRDQDAIATLLKSGEGRIPLRLRAVAMDHRRGEPFAIQVFG